MVPMLNEKGEVERYFGTYRDITDMVATEQQLAVETKKAQETELLKQAFLTNMSYEIRTPLNNIIGYAGLFTSDHDEGDEPFFIDQIRNSTSELLLVVNDVLYISRLEANTSQACSPSSCSLTTGWWSISTPVTCRWSSSACAPFPVW